MFVQSITEKKSVLNSIYAQMFVIVIAFVIMGISSFFLATNNEHYHLEKDAENALAYAESKITASLQNSEMFLNSYSETINRMILEDNSKQEVSSYLKGIIAFLNKNKESMSWLNNIHGYFLSWGGTYLMGKDYELPANYNPQESVWYLDAVKAHGRTVISEPYKDPITKNTVFTFSRCIEDNNGNILAVICIDTNHSIISEQAINLNLTYGSYGTLINNNLTVVAHPFSYFVGEKLQNIDSGISTITDELKKGNNIYKRRLKNYMYENTIVYFKKIIHGWSLGIIIPVHEYYRNVNNMAAFLIVIGSLLASALCIMLYYIAQAKFKSDKKTQQKSNFLATMSHEIRTPLNTILGMTEIQMQNTSHPPATSEAFIKINNSGNLLLSIINDILDLSKIEAGKLELVPVKYEVSSLINDIIQLNQIRYESKPINFNIEIDANIPSVLVGDELRIKQILNNLLSNAFKYTAHGSVTLSASAECIGRGGGAVVVTLIFRVKDTGQGMTPEQVSKLFNEYTRFNMEANRTTEGAGLGMTITRNLVDLMYGKISVKSAIGEGTTVNVRLPQKTDGIGIKGILGKDVVENLRNLKQSSSTLSKKTQMTHDYMPYGRVLIVDDVETNLYVAKGLMTPYGLKIDLAMSGFEAIEKVKAGNIYDIIFMDHMMPKMDGIETTKLLRNSGYVNPIVALTANAISGQAEMFMKNGFDDFISKPIDIRQLNISLNRLIRDKQPQDVLEAAQKEKEAMEKKLVHSKGFQTVDTQLAEIFARDAEKAIKTISACLQENFDSENDLQMYIINVHAMKSALANIGEKELSAAALKLEQAGREKEMNIIVSETSGFVDKLNTVVRAIKLKNKVNETVEDSAESLAFLKEKLIIIKEACADLDKKTAKNILIELREKTWSANTKELINMIAEHLLHSEFDEASALADKQIV